MSQILNFDFLASRSFGSDRASEREKGKVKIDSYSRKPCLQK